MESQKNEPIKIELTSEDIENIIRTYFYAKNYNVNSIEYDISKDDNNVDILNGATVIASLET